MLGTIGRLGDQKENSTHKDCATACIAAGRTCKSFQVFDKEGLCELLEFQSGQSFLKSSKRWMLYDRAVFVCSTQGSTAAATTEPATVAASLSTIAVESTLLPPTEAVGAPPGKHEEHRTKIAVVAGTTTTQTAHANTNNIPASITTITECNEFSAFRSCMVGTAVRAEAVLNNDSGEHGHELDKCQAFCTQLNATVGCCQLDDRDSRCTAYAQASIIASSNSQVQAASCFTVAIALADSLDGDGSMQVQPTVATTNVGVGVDHLAQGGGGIFSSGNSTVTVVAIAALAMVVAGYLVLLVVKCRKKKRDESKGGMRSAATDPLSPSAAAIESLLDHLHNHKAKGGRTRQYDWDYDTRPRPHPQKGVRFKAPNQPQTALSEPLYSAMQLTDNDDEENEDRRTKSDRGGVVYDSKHQRDKVQGREGTYEFASSAGPRSSIGGSSKIGGDPLYSHASSDVELRGFDRTKNGLRERVYSTASEGDPILLQTFSQAKRVRKATKRQLQQQRQTQPLEALYATVDRRQHAGKRVGGGGPAKSQLSHEQQVAALLPSDAEQIYDSRTIHSPSDSKGSARKSLEGASDG